MERIVSQSFSRVREKGPSECEADEGSVNRSNPHPTRCRRASFSRKREKGARLGLRHHLFALFAMLLFALAPTAAFAVLPSEMLKNPKLEARAEALSKQLRCLVCQNESIDDSDAPLAHDLRLLIRRRIKDGQSNQQIIKYLVSRYGDFILLKPPFQLNTLLLWGTPVLLLMAGGGAILLSLRKRRPMRKTIALSAAEEAKLAALVKEDG